MYVVCLAQVNYVTYNYFMAASSLGGMNIPNNRLRVETLLHT
jgi:hypothetical protein